MSTSPPVTRALMRQSWRSWWAYDGVKAGPAWLQWVWTALFGTGLALLFTVGGFAAHARSVSDWTSLANWGFWFGRNLIVCYTIGVVIQMLFMLILPRVGAHRIRAWSHAKRAVFFSSIPLLGLAVGWPLGVTLAGFDPGQWLNVGTPRLLGTLAISGLISLVFFFIFDAKARQAQAEKQAAEAQLRLLQGQIEPHFLFNTLANVLTLIDVDAPKAKRMLEAFTDYLRGSLMNLRRDDSTLDHELGMAQAYLCLMQTRMDERLAFAIDVADPALRRATLPPLLLQPLVENALHHGLECCMEGGKITVSARAEGNTLVLSVADNGLGLPTGEAAHRPARPGNGMALANIRARLASRYGDLAAFALEPQQPQGVRATIRLPLEAAA
jgi:signal transduction histidine kinase